MGSPDREFRVVSHGMLGYGFPELTLARAVDAGIDLIAVDAGSTDNGPFFLGSDTPFVSRTMVARDLELLLKAAQRAAVPIVIGSAGGAGTSAQTDDLVAIVREVAGQLGMKPRIASVGAELSKRTVLDALAAGRVAEFENGRPLSPGDVTAASHIVGQMGIEPIMAALETGADLVVAGRAWDPANIAALPVMKGFDRGLATHLGKILECGGQAAVPVEGSDLLYGRLRDDHFIVESTHPDKVCTTQSIAAHTLYEKTDPVMLAGPGGVIDLRTTRFHQLEGGRVRVEGTQYLHTDPYMIKIEGARQVGWRHVTVGGLRDPRMIAQIDDVTKGIQARLEANLAGKIDPATYTLTFHRYGLDGVMGALEPELGRRDRMPYEIGLVIDAVGETPEIAQAVCAIARSLTLHWAYPGRIATAGNFALPFSPADFPAGPVYEFNIYHLMQVDEPQELFPVSVEEL